MRTAALPLGKLMRNTSTREIGSRRRRSRDQEPWLNCYVTTNVVCYMNFEWDPRKARSNLDKHSVGFAEAGRVLFDPRRIETYDGTGADGEGRWKTIGMVEVVLLMVVYIVRGREADIIRLISARKADSHERAQYGQI
jgi:uncharacterized DUF497 family protein